MYEVLKPAIFKEDNQGDILLAKNRQVGMCTKHIDICHNFMMFMAEEKYTDMNYISSEYNPAYILTNICSEANCATQAKRIMEGELWDLVETVMHNVKNSGVMDGVMDFDPLEYYSHSRANKVNQENSNEWVLVARSRNGKKM